MNDPTNDSPLERLEFDTAQLVAEHPPRWQDRNKQLVYNISSPPGSVHAGRIDYTRWGAMPLPVSVDVAAAPRRVEARAGVYDYARVRAQPDAIEWHVNFADPNLFGAYASSILTQDEWQVAEHPALGALLEALNARGLPARTTRRGQPTPVLVTGVERRCCIDTHPDAAALRPHGLYGGMFSTASPDAIRRATHRIDPATISHIIAIAAPYAGTGLYTAGQIEHVLITAFSGFCAAVRESERLQAAPPGAVVVHSGFWGCGVFGGNRKLMVLLQMLAAEMAGVGHLVTHTVDESGMGAVDKAREILSGELAGAGISATRAVIEALEKMKFEWGVGDGN